MVLTNFPDIWDKDKRGLSMYSNKGGGADSHECSPPRTNNIQEQADTWFVFGL